MSGAILRFRVMALVAGTMSLLLGFGYMPAKYFLSNPKIHDYHVWIPMVHGFLYPIYIITAIQFSTKARWSLTKMLWLILAGTLPIASVAAERRVVRQYS